jgi:hypothetical protein
MPQSQLLLLKPLTRKSQRPTIFGYYAHNLVRSPGRNLGLHLERNGHRRADDARQMCDNLFGNPASIAAYASGIECDRAMEPPGERGR